MGSKEVIGVSQVRSSWKDMQSLGGGEAHLRNRKKSSVTGVEILQVEAGGSEVRLEKALRPPAWWGLLGRVSLRAAWSQQRN